MAESLARTEILRRRRDVARLRRFGAKTGTRFLNLRCAPNPDSPTDNSASSVLPTRRVAFLLSRGVGNAVARNRLKRRLRELYRRNKNWFPAGYDCVIQPSPSAGRLSFDELREQVRIVAQTKLNAGSWKPEAKGTQPGLTVDCADAADSSCQNPRSDEPLNQRS